MFKPNPDVLRQDLLHAAAPFMADALNRMTEAQRRTVVDKVEGGGWVELRIGTLGDATTIRVVVANLDGVAAELVRIESAVEV